MKKVNPNQITRHHISPKSRSKGKPILGVAKVVRCIHELSHCLFGNMKPEEIVEWLNKTLWNNEYEITIERRKK